MYPRPIENGQTVEVGGETLEAGDYLNKEITNRLGKTVYTGIYVIKVMDDEIRLFVLKDERTVTYKAEELASVLGDTLFHTGKKW